MATNPYSSQAISGYNASPPPDDGSQVAANRVTWAGIKTKLADTIKTLSEAINSATLSAFGQLVITTQIDEENLAIYSQEMSD